MPRAQKKGGSAQSGTGKKVRRGVPKPPFWVWVALAWAGVLTVIVISLVLRVPEPAETFVIPEPLAGPVPGESPPPSLAVPAPRLILVLDDAGHNLHQLEPFLRLPFPLTVAVLPFLPFSTEAARRLTQAGKEVMLHMPMEAFGGGDPGPGAIFLRDSPETARAKLAAALDSLPGLVGVNNHMGSAVTASEKHLQSLLPEIQARGLWFLDSYTSASSVVRNVARSLNLPLWERNVFLDNEASKPAILEALEQAKNQARRQGHAVMIGHVWTTELAEILLEVHPQLLEEGFQWEFLSGLYREDQDGEAEPEQP